MRDIPQGVVDLQEVLRYLERDYYMDKLQAAAYLCVSTRTLEARKDIPRFQLKGELGKGGKTLFKRSELDQWMELHRVSIDGQQDLARIAAEALEKVRGIRN